MTTLTMNENSVPAVQHGTAPGTPQDALQQSRAAAPVNARLSFDGILKGEWIKLLSLRSIRWSVLVMLALSWGGAALLSLGMAGSEFVTPETLTSVVAQAATFGSMFTVLIMGVLGVLAVTSEYASGMILSSLTAVPSRTPLLLAKALVVAALAFVVGALSTFGGALLSGLVLGDGALKALVDPSVVVSLFGNTLYLTLAALLALGIGTLLRSSAGAISAVVGLLFIAPIVFQVLTMTGWEWVPAVAAWLPANLGSTLSSSAMQSAAAAGSVSYWGALGGLAAWAAAALVPAAVLFRTRDAV